MENWKPVVGWEGLYEVSDQGRVRSLDRVIHNGVAPGSVRPGRILKPWLTHDGYQQVRLTDLDRRVSRTVHLLVLEAHVSPRPVGLEGCHNDGDPTNNVVGNLRWDTHSANLLDIARHARERVA